MGGNQDGAADPPRPSGESTRRAAELFVANFEQFADAAGHELVGAVPTAGGRWRWVGSRTEMVDDKALFLFVTGAARCVGVPELIRELVAVDYTVYSVLTPSVGEVTAPGPLMDVPGNHWIHAYQEEPLERYPFGTMLVAPCTFNTFNKIALGLADNLATSMIAEGLGAGNRVVIAPAMNHGLWSHPQTKASLARLVEWGSEVVLPAVFGTEVTLAPLPDILARLQEPGPLH